MNLVLKMRPVKPYICFRSDVGEENTYRYEQQLEKILSAILADKRAISVTYYSTICGKIDKCRIIVYNYGDETRYGYFRNGIPVSHTLQEEEFMSDICGIIRYSDLFIKA